MFLLNERCCVGFVLSPYVFSIEDVLGNQFQFKVQFQFLDFPRSRHICLYQSELSELSELSESSALGVGFTESPVEFLRVL